MTCDQIVDPAGDAPVERLRTTSFERCEPSRTDGYVCPIFQGHEKRENFADRVLQIRIAKDDNFAGRVAYPVTDGRLPCPGAEGAKRRCGNEGYEKLARCLR